MRSDPGAYSGPVEAVVFDYAGCLVDGPQDLSDRYENDDGRGVKAPVIAIEETLREYGIHLSWDRIREPMGLYKKDHLRALLTTGTVQEQFREEYGRDWNREDVDEMYDHLREVLVDVVVRDDLARPIDGAKAVLEELKRDGKLLGNTTGYGRRSATALNATLNETYNLTLDYDTHSDAVPAGRPHPWMLQDVMQALEVYPPHAVVKVGDTTSDIREAINAGVWSVGIYETGNDDFEELRDAGADFLLPSIRRVPHVVSDIENGMHRGVM